MSHRFFQSDASTSWLTFASFGEAQLVMEEDAANISNTSKVNIATGHKPQANDRRQIDTASTSYMHLIPDTKSDEGNNSADPNLTVASCERSFSTLKLIEFYLRKTMSQDRLYVWGFLSIEYKIRKSLDMESFITRFAEAKACKVKF